MSRFSDIQILEQFESEIDSKVHGIYWGKFNGKNKLFIRSGDSVAVVSHSLGLAHESVYIITDDVKEELFEAIK